MPTGSAFKLELVTASTEVKTMYALKLDELAWVAYSTDRALSDTGLVLMRFGDALDGLTKTPDLVKVMASIRNLTVHICISD